MFTEFNPFNTLDDFQGGNSETAEMDFGKTATINFQYPEVKRGKGTFTIVDYICYEANRGQGRKKAFFKLVDENGCSFVEFFSIEKGICAKLYKMIMELIGEQIDVNYDPNRLIGTKVEAFISYNYVNDGRIYANIAAWRLYIGKNIAQEGDGGNDKTDEVSDT